MRSAGNFHPEWGYLAPAPSFMRTARIVLVATAIGATAGAAVIISLVPRPSSDSANTSIAAHALVTSVPVVDEPPVATAAADESPLTQSPVSPPPQPAANSVAAAAASATKASSISPPAAQVSSGFAALSGAPQAAVANAESTPSSATPDEAAADPDAAAKAAKKHRTATQPGTKRWHNNRPFQPLFSLFSARSGPRSSF
jgi:hypothetical protein